MKYFQYYQLAELSKLYSIQFLNVQLNTDEGGVVKYSTFFKENNIFMEHPVSL